MNLLGRILEPTQILNDHLQYRDHVKICVVVELVGSPFKKVVLVDPESIPPGNYPSDSSNLILYVMVYCNSCAVMHVPGSRRRCDPPAFILPPRIESPVTMLMDFDDFNTRSSQIVTFKVPPRFRRPSNGQWFRCDCESLMYVRLLPNTALEILMPLLLVFPSH